MWDNEFFYQVYLIEDAVEGYYHCSYFQQSKDGFKLRIHKKWIETREKIDGSDYILMDEQTQSNWKEWIIDWCMTNSDYPGYLEFK